VSSPSLTNFASPTLVISLTLSVADWSQVDNTYQINVATANQVIQDYLDSPHNIWNYPSPGSDCPAVCLDIYSPPPSSIATPPNFLHILADVTAQQAYIVSPQLQYPPVSRLGTHYLCGSSEGLDNGLELEVIDEEEEMGNGKAGEAEDNGSEVG
jgi:hypothetical protein